MTWEWDDEDYDYDVALPPSNTGEWVGLEKPRRLGSLKLEPGLVLRVRSKPDSPVELVLIGHRNKSGGQCDCCGEGYDAVVAYCRLEMPK